jgi:hypothetical protein
MTAVVGTLPFIATLWLLVVLGAAVLEESGAKIAAALKGKSASCVTKSSRRANSRPTGRRSKRFETQWRAAA